MGGDADFLHRLRAGRDECPSDFALDRLHARELDADDADDLQAHLSGCADCEARLTMRRAGFDWPEAPDPRLMLARVRARLDEAPPTLTQQLKRWLLPTFIATTATAAAIVVVAGQTRPDTVRWKGDAATLHVFRLQNGQVVEALSGDRFEAGDRLRFRVDLAQEGRVAIIGVEPTGRLYRAWPQEEPPPLMARGHGLELPGAVALDDAPGPEILYLVHCPADVTELACRSTGASTPPACAEGCTSTSFVLTKATTIEDP